MRLGPVTKLDKSNKKKKKTKTKTPKEIDDDVMPCQYHFSNLRPIWSNPESGFTKTENRAKKSVSDLKLLS